MTEKKDIKDAKEMVEAAKQAQEFGYNKMCSNCHAYKNGVCRIGGFKVEGAMWYSCNLFVAK